MTDCKTAMKDLFEFLDKELDEGGCREFERHIELCRHCFDRTEFEKALRERIRQKTGKTECSDRLLKRIKGILDKFDE